MTSSPSATVAADGFPEVGRGHIRFAQSPVNGQREQAGSLGWHQCWPIRHAGQSSSPGNSGFMRRAAHIASFAESPSVIPRRRNTRTKWTSGLTSICRSCPLKQPKSSRSIRVAIEAIPAPSPWISCSVFSTSAGDASLQMAPASPPNRSQTSLAASDNVLAPCSVRTWGALPDRPATLRARSQSWTPTAPSPEGLADRSPSESAMPSSTACPDRRPQRSENAKGLSRMSLRVSTSSSFQSESPRVWPYSLSRSTTAFDSIDDARSRLQLVDYATATWA